MMPESGTCAPAARRGWGLGLGLAVAAAGLVAGTPAFGQFNVNDAFIANEVPEPGAEALVFPGPLGGTISLGYNLTPATPGTFSTANLVHTDAFNGNANLEGFFV